MNYFEAFEAIKTALEAASIPPTDGRSAIQVRISDEASVGTFYILASESGLAIEPYDYYDNDADILTEVSTLLDIIAGRLDFKEAVADKSVSVSGNIEAVTKLFDSIPKRKTTVKRTAAKKTAVKKGSSRAAKKKTEEAMEIKTTDDKKNTSGKETIEEVVEKEIKPKK